MASLYLERPTRSQAEILEARVADCRGAYLVVDFDRLGTPIVRETEFGKTRNDVVRDIAVDEYRLDGPARVLRVSVQDNETEDVTETVAREVAAYVLKLHRDEHEISISDIRCPFLDEVLPDWRETTRAAA